HHRAVSVTIPAKSFVHCFGHDSFLCLIHHRYSAHHCLIRACNIRALNLTFKRLYFNSRYYLYGRAAFSSLG
ncbi:MAG: hypothetical protein ACPG4A_00300, partial [Pseudomonadales bacterium]